MEAVVTSQGTLRLLQESKVETREKAASDVAAATTACFQQSSQKDAFASCVRCQTLVQRKFLGSAQSSVRRAGLIICRSMCSGAVFPNASYVTTADLEVSKELVSRVVDDCLSLFSDTDITVRLASVEALHEIVRVFHVQVVAERFRPLCRCLLQGVGDADRRISKSSIEISSCLKQVCTDANVGVLEVASEPLFSADKFVAFLLDAFDNTNFVFAQSVTWLLDWIHFVRELPRCNLVVHLPKFLAPLFRLLSAPENSKEVLDTLDVCLRDVEVAYETLGSGDEGSILSDLMLISVDFVSHTSVITRRVALRWVQRLMVTGRQLMYPLVHTIAGAVLEQVSSKDADARTAANAVNADLQRLVQELLLDGAEAPLYSINFKDLLDVVITRLKLGEELTRLAALSWIALIHSVKLPSGDRILNDELFVDVVSTLHSASTDVLRASLFTLSTVAGDDKFGHWIGSLLAEMSAHSATMLVKAPSIFLQLQLLFQKTAQGCPEKLFLKIAEILPTHRDVRFVCKVVVILQTMLLTLQEFLPLRQLLRATFDDERTQVTFSKLFVCWSYDPVAAIGLCLLTSAFNEAFDLVSNLGESEVTAHTLVQLDRMAQLIESPVFCFLRTGLLRPRRNAALVRALFGIQMILPQHSQPSQALHHRLQCAPTICALSDKEEGPSTIVHPSWDALLKQYKATQIRVAEFERSYH